MRRRSIPDIEGGSCLMAEWAMKMAAEKPGNMLPSASDVYARTHTVKDINKKRVYINNKAKEVMSKFYQLMDEQTKEGLEWDPDKLFYEAVGGRQRGVVPGLGSSTDLFYSPSKRRKDSTSSPSPSYVRRLEMNLEEAKSQVEAQDAQIKAQDARMEIIERQLANFSQLVQDNCGSSPPSQRHDTCDPGGGGGSCGLVA